MGAMKFLDAVRADMQGRGFREIGWTIPPHLEVLGLMFVDSEPRFDAPFHVIPVTATYREIVKEDMAQPGGLELLARKRCIEAADAYRELMGDGSQP
jgi:hypothetical protein